MNEERNITPIVLVVLAVFLILFIRLFQLQIIGGKENRFLAENNRTQKIVIPAPRGIIFDRHGEILAQNEPVYLLKDKEITREEALKIQSGGKEADFLDILRNSQTDKYCDNRHTFPQVRLR